MHHSIKFVYKKYSKFEFDFVSEVRRDSINLTPTPSCVSVSSQPSLTPTQFSSIATAQTSIATTRHSLQFEDDSSAAELDFDPMSTHTLSGDTSVEHSMSTTTHSVQSTTESVASSLTGNSPPVFFR